MSKERPSIAEMAREATERSRREQGFPPRVTDPDVLERVVALTGPALKQHQAGPTVARTPPDAGDFGKVGVWSPGAEQPPLPADRLKVETTVGNVDIEDEIRLHEDARAKTSNTLSGLASKIGTAPGAFRDLLRDALETAFVAGARGEDRTQTVDVVTSALVDRADQDRFVAGWRETFPASAEERVRGAVESSYELGRES